MISRVITYIRGLITLLVITHEPPSSAAVLCDMPLLTLTAAEVGWEAKWQCSC